MIQKGDILYYFPSGQVKYDDAVPAVVLSHAPCGAVATLKLLRAGTDMTKYDVKIDDHPSFTEFPHHRDHGVWCLLDECKPPKPKKKTPVRRKPAPVSGTGDATMMIDKMHADGMAPQQIAGRVPGWTAEQVREHIESPGVSK